MFADSFVADWATRLRLKTRVLMANQGVPSVAHRKEVSWVKNYRPMKLS